MNSGYNLQVDKEVIEIGVFVNVSCYKYGLLAYCRNIVLDFCMTGSILIIAEMKRNKIEGILCAEKTLLKKEPSFRNDVLIHN